MPSVKRITNAEKWVANDISKGQSLAGLHLLSRGTITIDWLTKTMVIPYCCVKNCLFWF